MSSKEIFYRNYIDIESIKIQLHCLPNVCLLNAYDPNPRISLSVCVSPKDPI